MQGPNMVNWTMVLMAGLGGMAIQLDPTQPLLTLIILCLKGFIGGAVGAYFGNHVSTRKERAKKIKKT